MAERHLFLEHDGKVLLVDAEGRGPQIPKTGRDTANGWLLRLPTEEEAEKMGLAWKESRTNRFQLGEQWHEVTHALPEIEWPKEWAWKDHLISDSAVHPVARESAYRTMHRLVAKVILRNPAGQVLMQKCNRGFFKGCWTLPGGFVDYNEHPRKGAERELSEELGVELTLADPLGEAGEVISGADCNIVQERIFTAEGIDYVSITYLLDVEDGLEITPKPDEVDEARWFEIEEAMGRAISLFDLEGFRLLCGVE